MFPGHRVFRSHLAAAAARPWRRGSLLAAWSPIAPLLFRSLCRGSGIAGGATKLWCIARPCALGAARANLLIAVTPQAIAIAVFLAGAVLLFSGATPGLGPRLDLLRDFVPLPILELSHLLGSAVGVGCCDCPRPVSALDAAWWLTIGCCAPEYCCPAQRIRL